MVHVMKFLIIIIIIINTIRYSHTTLSLFSQCFDPRNFKFFPWYLW